MSCTQARGLANTTDTLIEDLEMNMFFFMIKKCKRETILSFYKEGYRMVLFNLKVLAKSAKFGLCSSCSQKLDESSLARARKNFATACMLGFSLKFSAV